MEQNVKHKSIFGAADMLKSGSRAKLDKQNVLKATQDSKMDERHYITFEEWRQNLPGLQ